jgi:hypothetical protein
VLLVFACVGAGGGWWVDRRVPPVYHSRISIRFTGNAGLAGQIMVVWASVDVLLQRGDFVADVSRAVGSPVRARAAAGGLDTILITVEGGDPEIVQKAARLTAERVVAALADNGMRRSIDQDVNRRVPAPVIAEVEKWYDVSPRLAGDVSAPQLHKPRFTLAGFFSALGAAVFGLAVVSAIAGRREPR